MENDKLMDNLFLQMQEEMQRTPGADRNELFDVSRQYREISSMWVQWEDSSSYDFSHFEGESLPKNFENYLRCLILELPLPRIVEQLVDGKWIILKGEDVIQTLLYLRRTQKMGQWRYRINHSMIEVLSICRGYMTPKKVEMALQAMGY